MVNGPHSQLQSCPCCFWKTVRKGWPFLPFRRSISSCWSQVISFSSYVRLPPSSWTMSLPVYKKSVSLSLELCLFFPGNPTLITLAQTTSLLNPNTRHCQNQNLLLLIHVREQLLSDTPPSPRSSGVRLLPLLRTHQ